MTRFASLNQVVNTWECDEHDRMHVQFYFAKIADASRLFAAFCEMEYILSKRISRHVVYLSEVRSGAQLGVSSSFVTPDTGFGMPESGCFVQHVLENKSTGILAAAAIDRYEGTAWASHADYLDDLHQNAKPRTLIEAPDFGARTPEDFGETLIGHGVLHPSECTAEGVAREKAYVAAASAAGTEAWSQVGLDAAWLTAHGYSRVSTEMRLCVLNRMTAGQIYTLYVSFTALGQRGFTTRFDFFDMRDGKHLAFLENAVMLYNLHRRRSDPLPDFARTAIKERLTGMVSL